MGLNIFPVWHEYFNSLSHYFGCPLSRASPRGYWSWSQHLGCFLSQSGHCTQYLEGTVTCWAITNSTSESLWFMAPVLPQELSRNQISHESRINDHRVRQQVKYQTSVSVIQWVCFSSVRDTSLEKYEDPVFARLCFNRCYIYLWVDFLLPKCPSGSSHHPRQQQTSD